jgi:hypothetical protein
VPVQGGTAIRFASAWGDAESVSDEGQSVALSLVQARNH